MRPRDFHLRKFAIVLLLISPAALAQVVASKPAATQRVAFAPVATVKVAAGKSAQVELPFRVTSGYHINSNKPTSELLVPTVLKVNPPTDIAIAKLTYPAGEDRSFPFSPGDKLNVYTGDFTVTGLVRAARTTPPGKYRVRGMLKYQACDDRACYPPGQLPIAFDVRITKAASTRSTRRNPAQSPHVHPQSLRSCGDVLWLTFHPAHARAHVPHAMRDQPQFSIRRAASADAAAILDCLNAAFAGYRDRYTAAAYADTVLSAETIRDRMASMAVFVATSQGGEIVGTIGCQVVTPVEGHLRGMAVLPPWQGRGVAAGLLIAAEAELHNQHCARITLDTTEPLERAMRFYEKYGYRRSGKVTDFFGMPLFEYVKTIQP